MCITDFQISLYSMFVSIMAFGAKISDPKIGGTYMTLLNTVANLGGRTAWLYACSYNPPKSRIP